MSDYREIPLSKGQIAIVDASDYEWLNQWKWHAKTNPTMSGFYAARSSSTGGVYKTFLMHREILGLKAGNRSKADHRDPSQTLDNRRSNLRIASPGQSTQNRRRPKSRKNHPFKGVFLNGKTYSATIGVNGKKIHLGHRDTAEKAYLELYVPACIKYHGEFASPK